MYDEEQLEITYEIPIDSGVNVSAMEKENWRLCADCTEVYSIHETQIRGIIRGAMSVSSSFQLEIENELNFVFPLERQR